MPTKITWSTSYYNPHSSFYEVGLSKVHVILEDNVTVRMIRNGPTKYTTLCGVEISRLEYGTRIVKNWNNRPCNNCVNKARKLNLDITMPRAKSKPKDGNVMAGALKVNMANVGGTFDLMDTARYMSFFTKYEVKSAGPKAKNPGSKYFSLEYQIDGDAHAEYKNRKQWGSLGGTVSSLWAVKEFLITMGYPAEELDAEDPDAKDPSEMTEAELVAAISEMLDKVKGGRVYLDVAVETYDRVNKRTKEVEQAQRNVISEYVSIYEEAVV